VVTADDVPVGAMILRIIFFAIAAIQLACCIALIWQWLLGAEDPRFEGEKIVYR
jgi:hypothetical protein